MARSTVPLFALIALLLLGVAAGNTLATGLQPAATAGAGLRIPAPTDPAAPAGPRKLPPPPGSIAPAPPNPNYQPAACVAPVVNVSARAGNEDESYVVVNPTNPNNIVAFSNLTTDSIFRAYSFNGGATWTRGTVATNVACCDGQAVFDTFGNLFLVYINNTTNQINVLNSTDGGVTFSAPTLVGSGSIDQPSIAVGAGSLWVDWNLSGNMVARGAPVTGLGAWGPFGAQQAIPSAAGSFGGIAVGPGPNGGKVMVTYQNPTGGQGPATIYVNVDADGLGAGGFGARSTATTTNVGGFDFIPAQAGRSIDAEAGLVWDATGGPFNNRAYLVYTEETVNENNDTEIYLRTSTDDGATWTAPVRVNDDPTSPIRSQFLPYIALDRSSGTVAIGWQDARNDNGVVGSGGTNTTPNDDAEYYASYSTNGGVSWAANTRLSGGFSNAAAAAAPVDYGDYEGQDAYGGKFVAVWADNANCDGSNANGTLSAFDLYMGTLTLPSGGQTATPTASPTRTATAGNTPTRTATSITTATNTPINTATASNTPTNTATPTPTPSNSATRTPTPIPTATGTATATSTPPSTATATNTATRTATATSTPPSTATTTPAAATATSTVCPITFSDVPSTNPFYIYIRCLACRGIVSGYADGTYRWGADVTRGQLSKIIANAAGLTNAIPSTQQTFEDVSSSNAFWLFVERLAGTGAISGYQCGGVGEPCVPPGNRPYFRWTANATRGQIAKITAVAAQITDPIPTTQQTFEDVPVSNPFWLWIEQLAGRGVISGYTCGGPGEPCVPPGNRPYFRWTANATRGQMAKIAAQTFYPNCRTPARR